MKIKTSWVLFFLSLITILPLRIYQRLFALDIHMGFSVKGDISLQILLGALVVFTLLVVWLCSKDKKAPALYLKKPNFMAGLFGFFLAVSVGMESVMTLSGSPDLSGITVEVTTSKTILGIAGIIAALAFLILSIDAFRGGNTFEKHPYLSLLLPLWGLVRLTVSFIQFNTETGNENMFDSFAMIACLLFLYSQSRLLVGIEQRKTLKSSFSFGFLTVLTCLMAIVPRYLGYALIHYFPSEGISNQIFETGLTPYPTDLFFALYVFAFLVGLYFQSYKKGMVIEAETKAAEAAALAAAEQPVGPQPTVYTEDLPAQDYYPAAPNTYYPDGQPQAPYYYGQQPGDYYGQQSPQSYNQPPYGSGQPNPGEYYPSQHPPYPPNQNYPR